MSYGKARKASRKMTEDADRNLAGQVRLSEEWQEKRPGEVGALPVYQGAGSDPASRMLRRAVVTVNASLRHASQKESAAPGAVAA